jgi:hypothetical protein
MSPWAIRRFGATAYRQALPEFERLHARALFLV